MSDPAGPLLRIGRTDFFVRGGRLEGNILHSGAEVLVSSASTNAAMRGGVSLAILRKGGPTILDGLRAHKPLVPGDVVITNAGDLLAKNIYHAVVVTWGEERRVLQATIWRAVNKCIALAQLSGVTSIAFPSLGTGAGKADRFETHSTMAAACFDALRADSSLRQILFCFDYADTAETFRRAFLQQRLIRQARGLLLDDATPPDQLSDTLQQLWPHLMNLQANVGQLSELVTRLEQNPAASVINYFVKTEGGAFIKGDVSVEKGGKFVGRDEK
jgi:O-acetyl-ADP-ribose deacetylase (regulator of RNase III)